MVGCLGGRLDLLAVDTVHVQRSKHFLGFFGERQRRTLRLQHLPDLLVGTVGVLVDDHIVEREYGLRLRQHVGVGGARLKDDPGEIAARRVRAAQEVVRRREDGDAAVAVELLAEPQAAE